MVVQRGKAKVSTENQVRGARRQDKAPLVRLEGNGRRNKVKVAVSRREEADVAVTRGVSPPPQSPLDEKTLKVSNLPLGPIEEALRLQMESAGPIPVALRFVEYKGDRLAFVNYETHEQGTFESH